MKLKLASPLVVVLAAVILNLAVMAVVLWVAWHFISKWW